MPELKKKLEAQTGLFSPHDIRHGNLNWLLLHGRLNKYEVKDFIGHTSVHSQDEYEKSTSVMYQVAKMMEVNEHYGAKNSIVLPKKTTLKEDINREEFLLANDVEEYLYSVDNNLNNIEKRDAEEYIDKETECSVLVSCSATGITCLGCEDFRAGVYNEQKMNNVTKIIVEQINIMEVSMIINCFFNYHN